MCGFTSKNSRTEKPGQSQINTDTTGDIVCRSLSTSRRKMYFMIKFENKTKGGKKEKKPQRRLVTHFMQSGDQEVGCFCNGREPIDRLMH